MHAQAPAELAQIGLPPDLFKRSDDHSWRGPCPVCGGHRRFVLLTQYAWPYYYGWCDECGHTLKAWEKVITPIDDEKRREAQERIAAHEQVKQAERQRKLAEFTTHELWQELHRRLSADHRAQWEAWGVPQEWQDYLELGFTPDKAYYNSDGVLKHTAAYTIPYFHYTPDKPQFKTMQYRLFNTPDPNDRYRFEHGLAATYYVTVPTDPIGDVVIICEGAKKGIVTRVHLTGLCVLAIPSKSTWAGIAETVKPCGRVYVLPDPDALLNGVQLARRIGKQARLVRCAIKIDDAVTMHGLERIAFEAMLNQAWRVS